MEQPNRWNRGVVPNLRADPRRRRPTANRGRKRVIVRLDLEASDRVLLLGTGTGADLASLPEDVSVTAVDLTPAMVDRIEARAESLGTADSRGAGSPAALRRSRRASASQIAG